MRLLVGFSIYMLVLVGCIQDVDIEIPVQTDKVVLSSILSANKQIKVYVGKTSRVEIEGSPTVDDAVVIVLENEEKRDTLALEGNGWYISEFTALPSNSYKIIAQVDGDSVWAIDTVPEINRIDQWDHKRIETGDPTGDDFHEITLLLENTDRREYFEFEFIRQECNRNNPTLCYIDFFLFGSAVDPKIKAEGIVEFNPSFYVLSDELFEGEHVSVFFQLLNSATRGGNGIERQDEYPEGDFLSVGSTSKQYYLFKKSLIQYKDRITTDEKLKDFQKFFFGSEPTALYSNVHNGVGAVVSVNKEYVEIFD